MQTIAATGSPGLPVGLVVVALVVGFVGYRVAASFRSREGISPWGAAPILWGLLFAVSWLIGLVLYRIARSSTERDLEISAPAGRGRSGARLVAATILLVVGVGALAGGAIGLVTVGHTDLAQLVVRTPTPGMVATSVGNGGPKPTRVLTGARGGDGIRISGVVPTQPTIYLPPAGAITGSESAYWKVWWDGAAQQADVVSLQQHLSDADASREASFLDGHDSNMTSCTSFAVAGVPGAVGHVCNGTKGGTVLTQFRFVVFSRDSVVALVSTFSYAGKSSASAFDAFVRSEYVGMARSQTPLPTRLLIILIGLGLAIILAGAITLIGAFYRRRLPTPSFGPGPNAAAGAGYLYAPRSPYPAPSPGSTLAPARGAAAPGTLPPAGWYADPSSTVPGALRYWDGGRWIDATAPPPQRP